MEIEKIEPLFFNKRGKMRRNFEKFNIPQMEYP